MDTEAESFMRVWLRRKLAEADAELRRIGYFDNPEVITDLVKDEGPRLNQIIAAFKVGQAYSEHRMAGYLIKELERDRPFFMDIANERLKEYLKARKPLPIYHSMPKGTGYTNNGRVK
jgi:hypothetical protein